MNRNGIHNQKVKKILQIFIHCLEIYEYILLTGNLGLYVNYIYNKYLEFLV